MSELLHATKKTALVLFWLMLFVALLMFFVILFLAVLQWFMHTEYYLTMVGSVEFWKWVAGVPIIIIFLVFCSNNK